MILSHNFINYQTSPDGTPWEDIPDDGSASGGPFSGNGNFPNSSISNILFAGSISNTGTISQQGFSFGGIHGTITEFGSFSQSVYSGVTTYLQYFEETGTLSNGVAYVQQFLVYGNIYEGTVTVNAMSIPHN